MKMATVLFVALSLVVFALAEKPSDTPAYVGCLSNNDCDPGHCCSIGQDRYSYPTCRPMQAKGDVCRPGKPLLSSEPRYYPDGLVLHLNNVHLTFCPCADGLVCDRAGGQCHEA